jgi:hypothetical protein
MPLKQQLKAFSAETDMISFVPSIETEVTKTAKTHTEVPVGFELQQPAHKTMPISRKFQLPALQSKFQSC